MVSAHLQRPMAVLTWSFVLQVTALFGMAALILARQGETTLAAIGVVVVLAVSGLIYYVALGVLARRLHRSWIVWVGLVIITSPIGWIVAYFMMLARVKATIAETGVNE